MSHLVVIAYPDEGTAELARDRLAQLQRQNLITLDDAAIAVRRENGKVKIKQLANLTGVGTLSGAFWGTLIGLIFLNPLLGTAVGAAAGALSGKAMDIGVDDQFIKEVGEALPRGASALFLLVVQATPDKVLAEMKEFGGKIIRTNLTGQQEAELREAFANA